MERNNDQNSNDSQPVVASPKSRSLKNLSALQVLVIVIVLVVILDLVIIISHSINHNKSTTTSSTLSPAEVSITTNGFVPASVKVKVGQGVVWTNDSTANHEVASDPYPKNDTLAGFDEKQPLIPRDNFSFVFNKAGTYSYHDNLNPYTMKGVVIVVN